MQTPASAIPVFVFGSNLAGRHGKGAALWARQHRGAIYGQGVGRQGDAYAIPTKDLQLRVLPLHVIQAYVAEFLDYARQRSDVRFELTPIGCGLAGYRPDQIAPMFSNAPANVTLPHAFSAETDARPHALTGRRGATMMRPGASPPHMPIPVIRERRPVARPESEDTMADPASASIMVDDTPTGRRHAAEGGTMRVAYPLRVFLDCSTAHLSPAARAWLDRGGGLVAPTPHGWFVWAEADPDGHVPADLVHVMRHAREAEAEYILFDADAPEIAALPVFDW